MQIKIYVILAMLAVFNYASAQSDDRVKLSILDRKFRTRVSSQPTAFVFSRDSEGVELGCYGYIKDGRPFKMYYVFDEKDYRFITTTMRFQVHPRGGAKRRFAILTPHGKPDKEKTKNDVLRYPEECL